MERARSLGWEGVIIVDGDLCGRAAVKAARLERCLRHLRRHRGAVLASGPFAGTQAAATGTRCWSFAFVNTLIIDGGGSVVTTDQRQVVAWLAAPSAVELSMFRSVHEALRLKARGGCTRRPRSAIDAVPMVA